MARLLELEQQISALVQKRELLKSEHAAIMASVREDILVLQRRRELYLTFDESIVLRIVDGADYLRIWGDVDERVIDTLVQDLTLLTPQLYSKKAYFDKASVFWKNLGDPAPQYFHASARLKDGCTTPLNAQTKENCILLLRNWPKAREALDLEVAP